MKIGIIGAGFVGGAIKNAYDLYDVPVLVRDPDKGYNSTWEELRECDGVFVSVPSPPKNNGEADTSILEEVLENLKGMPGVIISKVTAPPSVYTRLHNEYPNLVHSPEFLVAATANEDFINGHFAFIGGSEEYVQVAEEIIRIGQRNLLDVKFSTIAEAALAKYTINSFLALKVSFLNQLYDLSKELNIDYYKLQDLLSSEKRLGESHMHVPGPDGSRGFGGACFPKDTKALVAEAKNVKVNLSILESAIKYNDIIREKKN